MASLPNIENTVSGARQLLPCFPCVRTPGGSASVVGDPTVFEVTPGGELRPWQPTVTPEMESPVVAANRKRSLSRPAGKKSRRPLNLTDNEILNVLYDSGSEGSDSSCAEEQDEEEEVLDNAVAVRALSRRLRNAIIQEDEANDDRELGNVYERGAPSFIADSLHIFEKIWDHEFMETVVKETNLYAWQNIAQLSDPDVGTGIPLYLESWVEVTVGELYRYFALLIIMSFCHRSVIREYWSTGILGMPGFRAIMPRNRFLLLNKFIHFMPSINLLTKGNDRKIEKVAPVVDHCNRKFAEMYTPSQYLSLDESLLLWKGRLSWRQCIRSKAARFGIKSFELCESQTGYLRQYRLYTGKRVEMHPGALHGFQDHTAKVVLDLIEKYLDAGHVLVMDNWYNQLPLTRYLKTRNTDVLGTMNRRRQGIPAAIKDLIPKQVKRGKTVTRHSGDIALVAWRDVKLVTVMSTYHQHLMVSGRRAGQAVLKPQAVVDYNRHMGGVDLKDQKLSLFLMERKRCLKWYMKVFRRLLNSSILNAFLIYSRNPMHQVYSHRQFRFKIAEGLLSRYPSESLGPSKALSTTQPLCFRLQPGNHFPIYTEMGSGIRRKRLRCIRCYNRKQRVEVNTLCELCQVPLCVGKCWKEYHTMLHVD